MIATPEYYSLKAKQFDEKKLLETKHQLEMTILAQKLLINEHGK
jgi:hypothetical protein